MYIPTDPGFGGGWEPEPVSKWVQLGCWVAKVVFYPRQSTLNALSNAPWLCPVVLPQGPKVDEDDPLSGREGPD